MHVEIMVKVELITCRSADERRRSENGVVGEGDLNRPNIGKCALNQAETLQLLRMEGCLWKETHTMQGPPKKPAKKRHTANAAKDFENDAPRMNRLNRGKESKYTTWRPRRSVI